MAPQHSCFCPCHIWIWPLQALETHNGEIKELSISDPYPMTGFFPGKHLWYCQDLNSQLISKLFSHRSMQFKGYISPILFNKKSNICARYQSEKFSSCDTLPAPIANIFQYWVTCDRRNFISLLLNKKNLSRDEERYCTNRGWNFCFVRGWQIDTQNGCHVFHCRTHLRYLCDRSELWETSCWHYGISRMTTIRMVAPGAPTMRTSVISAKLSECSITVQ